MPRSFTDLAVSVLMSYIFDLYEMELSVLPRKMAGFIVVSKIVYI